MRLKSIGKAGTIATMAFAAALLAGCREDDKGVDNAAKTPAPAATRAEKPLDPQFRMVFDDIAIRTATGRELRVSAEAYCTPQIGKNRTATDAYREACRQAVGENMMYAARHEDSLSRFEVFLPMGSTEIRAYNMFTPDMMMRAAAMHPGLNIYTVTDVVECGSGARVAPLNVRGPAPADGWPDKEARLKSQSVKPAIGKVVGGACTF